jgi:hypothetical protein
MLRASLLPAGTGEKRNQSTRVTHPSRSTHRPPRADVPERRDGRATCDRVSASASPSCAALLLGCGVKVLVGPGPGRPTGKEAAAIFTSEEQLQLLAQGRRTSITPRTAAYGGDEDPRTLCTQRCGAASRPGVLFLRCRFHSRAVPRTEKTPGQTTRTSSRRAAFQLRPPPRRLARFCHISID